MRHSLNYLAVDIGAESGRLMAGHWQGSSISLQEIHRFSNGTIPVGGTLRWDLLQLWRQIQNGLQKAAHSMDGSVQSIGVDTWGVDYVLLSRTGEWLGLPYAYRDRRTHGLVEEILSIIPREVVFQESGTQFLEINTLCQLLAAQRQTPELLAQAKSLLLIPDWIHWALCGAEVCEFTNASTTQFVHPVTRQWSRGLLDRLGIPSHFLPEIVQPGTSLGLVREEVGSSTGLPSIPVIAPATHDTGSAIAAIPTDRTGSSNWAYISSGTWSLVGAEVSHAQLGEAALRHNFTNEGGVDGTYRLLKNVMGMWLLQQLRTAFAQAGSPYDYASLVQLAAQAPALRSFIHPDDSRFLRPTAMIQTIQAFCRESKQPIPETPGALARCVLESLALRYRQVLAQLHEITGQRPEIVHIVGGGSRNTLLNQFTADACGLSVVAGPVEATALGNILLQARASQEINSLADIRSVVRHSCNSEIETFHPTRNNADAWQNAYQHWVQLCSEKRP